MRLLLPSCVAELTPTQAKRLFGNEPRNSIACGTRGCAYQVGNHVVKITDDVDDAVALKRAQGLKHVATVQRVYKLPGAGKRYGREVDLYAIVMERMPKHMAMKQYSWLDEVWFDTELRQTAEASNLKGKPFVLPRASVATSLTTCKGDRACVTAKREFALTIEELFKRGIQWVDFGQSNIMVDKDGTWKIVDLGHSDVKGGEQLPTLTGAYVRRRK